MTNMVRVAVVGATVIVLCVTALPQPLDVEVGKKFPALRQSLENARTNGVLSGDARTVVTNALFSGDDILVGVGSFVVGECVTPETNLLVDLTNKYSVTEGFAGAFLTLTFAKAEANGKPANERAAVIQPLLSAQNGILRVEAAKALVRYDYTNGVNALTNLLNDTCIEARGAAYEHLRRLGQIDETPIQPPSEVYSAILSLIN